MTETAEPVPVVWLTKAEPKDDAVRSLAAWARSHGIVVEVATNSAPPSSAAPAEASVRDAVERELHRAREAIASLDADAAERALARAEKDVRDHPELPEAAWLRAEVLRAWATRFLRIDPKNETRARQAWEEADGIDGGRVPGVGEATFPKPTPRAGKVRVFGGRRDALVVRLDGTKVPRASGSAVAREDDPATVFVFEAPSGEHLLTVEQGAGDDFAAWVSVAARHDGDTSGAMIVDVPLPDVASCSSAGFRGVTRNGSQVDARGVQCPRWIAAHPSEHGKAILVATCENATCGPLVEWRADAPIATSSDSKNGAAKAEGHGWPAWATWTLVGVGAAATTVLVLAAAGVFAAPPTEPRFVAGGVRVE